MSCLFDSIRALAIQQKIVFKTSDDLRKSVVKYIRGHKNMVMECSKKVGSTDTPGKCSKCNGNHISTNCPWFKKPREKTETFTLWKWTEQTAKDQNKTTEQYLRDMLKSHVWGGGLEMAVLSRILNVTIQVVRTNRNSMSLKSRYTKVAHFNFANQPKTEYHLHWNGSHFTPLKIIEYNN